MLEIKIKNSVIQLEIADLTLTGIESIVYYAQPNLQLGSGFGNAIAVRGGSSIQQELESFGTISTTEAVITSAGELESKYIIHAVGPRFREPDIEEKLTLTMQNILDIVKEKNIREIGFPPMGTGFYGIPLELSAKVMIKVLNEFINKENHLEKVLICVVDKREFIAFNKVLNLNENIKD